MNALGENDGYDDTDDLPADVRSVIYASYANINTGTVNGGQRVQSGITATQTQRIEALEGPISSLEILEAERGFAEPPWFPAALAQLGTGVLFLTGAPRTGRRTAALNLLRRHTGGGLNFRAVDGSTDLDLWQPKNKGTLGYLVDGLVPTQPLKPAVLGNLRDRLRTERASMVIILPDDPELLRRVERDLHLTPVRCEPPPPRAVFDARLEAEIPDAGQRAAFLERLEPGLVDELLAPELVPAEVAELVALLTGPDQEGEDIRSRLSFLAEDEAPELIDTLRDDPDGLAFLMAACVFEGLDHRVVREEADRLLEVADGQLAALLPATEGSSEVPRDNPRFVFRRSLDDLLRTVRAQCAPKEIRTASGFTYAVEPVRFTRHRKAETVLRHVWREYGRLSVVLTAWLEGVKDDSELATPAGHVMGLAAGWGGGRRALGHISTLAGSDTGTGRRIAAHALGMAADDPVLATEVKYRLTDWSRRAGWQRRTTVAHACGTRFGLARPDLALSLLRRLPRSPQSDEEERHVNRAIRAALAELFTEDTRPMVFRCVLGWADADPEWEADLAFAVLPSLLHGGEWFGEELLGEGEFSAPIVDLVRRALDRDASFGPTGGALLSWCREGTWNERRAQAVTTLFDHLARDMRHGTLRLFVEIDRHSAPDLAGRDTARRALNAWRAGASSPAPEGTPR